MLSLIKIPDEYKLASRKNRTSDLKARIYAEDDIAASAVTQIDWIASFNPVLGAVLPTRTETKRYDEMQVFHLTISDPQMLYLVCAPIYKTIPYPCLLLIQYKDRWVVSICPFRAGKLDYNANTKRSPIISHWIFPQSLTSGAEEVIHKINYALVKKGDLAGIYQELINSISGYEIRGITRKRADELVQAILGPSASINNFWNLLTPYKKYYSSNKWKRAKSGGMFHYSIDLEDLWHAFMSDPKMSMIIEKRRYRNMDELIYYVNELSEADSWRAVSSRRNSFCDDD